MGRSRTTPGRAAAAPAPARRWRRRAPVLLVVLIALVAAAAAVGLEGGWPAAGGAPSEGPLDPAAFAPGACVALAPSAGDNHRTVFLDAGHGGVDPGAVGSTEAGTTVYEGTLTLPVELDAAALLRARGYRVVVSRTADTTVVRLGPADLSGGALSLLGAHDDVAARDRCADLARADVLVGIYFDAGAGPQDAGSVTAYDAVRPFAAANQRLATLVQQDVLEAMNAQGWGIPDDGVVTDGVVGSLVPTSSASPIARGAATYGHLLLLGPADPGYFSTPSLMPGAVVEPLFVTDPFEASVAVSAHGQQVIARGIAAAVQQFSTPAHG